MSLKNSTPHTCPAWMARAFAATGGAGVALGAFGAHALKDIRSAQHIETWKTATLYLLVHAAVGLCLTLTSQSSQINQEKSLVIPVLGLQLLLFGSVIFAGALYLLVLIQLSPLGAVAPVGGLMMIAGWLVLATRLRT